MKATTIAALGLATFAFTGAARADETTGTPSPTPAPTAGTTTTTGADVGETVTPAPPPAVTPATRETVTLYEKRRPNRPLLGIGAAVFAGTYATTVALTAANRDSNDQSMYIPVVGPWLALKDADYDTSKTLLYAGSGVLQGAGLALGIASFLIPEKMAAVTIQAKGMKMNVLPTSYGSASGGLGAVGTF